MTDGPTAIRIRVALRLPEGPIPAYLVAAADAVCEAPGVDVVLVVMARRASPRRSMAARLIDTARMAYDWIERRALRGGSDALLTRRADRVEALPNVVRGDVAVQVDALRDAVLDVLIDLGPDDGSVGLPVPPGGRWRLRYSLGVGGARRPTLERPSRAVALAESLLVVTDRSGAETEAEVGVSAVHRVGYVRDRDAVYWRSALLPARRLVRPVEGTDIAPEVAAESEVRAAAARDVAPVRVPVDRAWPPFLGLAAVVAGKVVERLLFRTGWFVLVRDRGPDAPPPSDLSGFRAIEAPAGRFYADPFVISTAAGMRMLVEDCPDGAHRGRISVLEMDDRGAWSPGAVLLDDIEHRAYPHAVRSDSGLVITPDGGRHGGVDVFGLPPGSELDPSRLDPVGRVLGDVPASDPTLLWHDGTYWLFVAVTRHGMNPWDELHLFHAAAVAGPWLPHPRNPVVADVRSARPAGRIFRHGDVLIRPAQDCSVAYGRRVVLNAVTILTTEAYEEEPIGHIEPVGYPDVTRTHTYTFDGTVEAVDGYRRRPRWRRRPPGEAGGRS